jgi:hypothetical protein
VIVVAVSLWVVSAALCLRFGGRRVARLWLDFARELDPRHAVPQAVLFDAPKQTSGGSLTAG